jgi:hypothetical protein
MFRTPLFCNTNGNGVFGETGEGFGQAVISRDGHLAFAVNGLDPGSYSCKLACDGADVFEGSCTANVIGELSAVFVGVASPTALPAFGCAEPTPSISSAGVEVCIPGYGAKFILGQPCGPVTCPSTLFCCNPLAGICVAPGQVCVQQ